MYFELLRPKHAESDLQNMPTPPPDLYNKVGGLHLLFIFIHYHCNSFLSFLQIVPLICLSGEQVADIVVLDNLCQGYSIKVHEKLT